MKPHLTSFILFLLVDSTFAVPNVPLQKDVDPPRLLSETKVFDGDVSLLKPGADFKSYVIVQALFVDHAQKQRMIYLPKDTPIGFSPTEPYAFPVGTVLVKHFQMETSLGMFQNLETRILVRQEGSDQQNWVGYTYQWEGNDALLVDATSNPELVLNIDASAPGGARQQKYKIPSRRQCLQCHNASMGFVRSFETRQLNRLVNGTNQLAEFSKAGIFDREVGNIKDLESYAAIENEDASLDQRVKSYVSVNCAHCHNPNPAAPCNFTGLDFRFATFSTDALVTSGHLVKRDKENSEIYKRMNSTAPGFRMPFIGSVLKDTSALEVIGKWIDQL